MEQEFHLLRMLYRCAVTKYKPSKLEAVLFNPLSAYDNLCSS